MRTLVAVPSLQEFQALYPFVDISPESSAVPRALNAGLSVGVPGVGGAAFGAHLAKMVFSERFDCVCIAGICGAYPDSGLGLCDVVRVDSECQGDFGYEAEDGMFNPFPATPAREPLEQRASAPMRSIRKWRRWRAFRDFPSAPRPACLCMKSAR